MWILIIIALIIGAFAGYYYEKTKMSSQLMMVQSDLQKQLDSAKMENEKLMKDQSAEEKGTMMKDTTPPAGAMMEK